MNEFKTGTYDVSKHGVITAIRIFANEKHCGFPYAELAFEFGGSVIVQWNRKDVREEYEKGINSYTFVFDERIEDRSFSDFVKRTKN